MTTIRRVSRSIVQSSLMILAVLVLLGADLARAEQQGPTDRLKEGIDKVLAVLKDPNRKDKDQPVLADATMDQLEGIAKNYFDFEELTMRSVGQPWLSFTPQQKNDMIAAFTDLLERTYIQKAADYNDEKVDYQKEMIQGNKAFVLTSVSYQDKQVPVNYRMILKDQWMVYDVIIEGVSLVQNYRTQFDKILRTQTPDQLIALVKDKNTKLDDGTTQSKTDGAKAADAQ